MPKIFPTSIGGAALTAMKIGGGGIVGYVVADVIDNYLKAAPKLLLHTAKYIFQIINIFLIFQRSLLYNALIKCIYLCMKWFMYGNIRGEWQ